ncbi:hypothetical protein PAXRUDRAFT_734317 [Paxillus rubicundulus Ve08.2h10]|uniref:Uncharacterized protein n=1 Tax=Paxillus rubicundulus Ve08.2h10 TaxID=930991 RepID=A0A0D0DK00_9AGAM|nr:hypothetical protein PAXRUDRAFT_734317 [Paxillus rubicundulus Ve08.2h10]
MLLTYNKLRVVDNELHTNSKIYTQRRCITSISSTDYSSSPIVTQLSHFTVLQAGSISSPLHPHKQESHIRQRVRLLTGKDKFHSLDLETTEIQLQYEVTVCSLSKRKLCLVILE